MISIYLSNQLQVTPSLLIFLGGYWHMLHTLAQVCMIFLLGLGTFDLVTIRFDNLSIQRSY